MRKEQELGSEHMSEQGQEEEKRRAQEQADEATRQGMIARALEAGVSLEEANAVYARLWSEQDELVQLAEQKLKDDPSPEGRNLVDEEAAAFFKRVTITVLGEEKAKAFVKRLEEYG